MIRSFLAIELTESIRNRIREVQEDLRGSKADVRWVTPGHIHLTLKFFGNIEELQIESIIKAIAGPVSATSPMSLLIRGVGAFPSLKNPRVIWVGVKDDRNVLTPFQNRLERELERVGFQPENRPFQPHLTLGRMRSNRGKSELVTAMEKHREEEFGNLEVEKVILFKSDLTPNGPIYTPLREIGLGR